MHGCMETANDREFEDWKIRRLATTLCGTQGYEFRYYNQNIKTAIKIKKEQKKNLLLFYIFLIVVLEVI